MLVVFRTSITLQEFPMFLTNNWKEREIERDNGHFV